MNSPKPKAKKPKDNVTWWRLGIRWWLTGGATLLLAVGCLLPHLPAWLPTRGASLSLPDLDEDGKAERLWLQHTPRKGSILQLASTNRGGHLHDVLTLPLTHDERFEGQGPWLLKGPGGESLLEVRTVQPAGRTVPDMLVLAGDQAKRYVFLERGFLKLDAYELIPGFSVGLLMLGDMRDTVQALGRLEPPGDTWQAPLQTPLSLALHFDQEDRLERVTTRSPRLRMRPELGVGSPAKALDARFPGTQHGDLWQSPRYGLTAIVNGNGLIQDVCVTRPWKEGRPRSH
ncbi:MAG: hypothetical protein VKP62_10320 [Candidatus Sericytochromatia bacterium]|nr:hypothetical protein [Candidatus Sericytochromatia bacterium]